MAMRARTLGWLDMQGYCLTDEEKRRLAIPLKFAPFLCWGIGTAGLALQSWPILATLTVIAFVGGVLPRHPFDYVYAITIERVVRTGMPPANTPQRRFACLMAASMLGLAAWGFAAGVDEVGWVFGGMFSAASFLVWTTNWCMPSFIYNTALSLAGREPLPTRR